MSQSPTIPSPSSHGGDIIPTLNRATPQATSPHHLASSTCATTSNNEEEVNHTALLSSSIGSLFLDTDCSDVVVEVDGRPFPTHKIILASRSPYFRALFFGGLSESSPDTKSITLQNTSAAAFEIILKYIYTGRMQLANTREELVLDVLELAHRYDFLDLEISLCRYLSSNLSCDTVCSVYNVAKFYEFQALRDACAQYIDTHGEDMMRGTSYLTLSLEAFCDIISRDSFCAKEVDIARAVARWGESHSEEDIKTLIQQIRLPLITIPELLQVVRPLNLISSDALLDAIHNKTCSRDTQLNYRGLRMADINILTTYHGAQVTCGELGDHLLDGDTTSYDLDHGFARHRIDDAEPRGIVVKLGAPSIINHVKLLMWDRDRRAYSYYLEISVDQQDWIRIIDYSQFLCRSWQKLYFPARVAKYIRVVGTHNTVNRVFHLVHMEAMYVNTIPEVNAQGIQVPRENIATVPHGAMVLEGISRSRNALINGNTTNYDWDSGYTCHQLGDGYILLSLSQPYILSSMRLLLWDCDLRSYSYYIDVSTNLSVWHRVIDRSQVLCKSWQKLTFPPRPVTHIKIVGTRNTANEVFHCVHFECPDISSLTPAHPLPSMRLSAPSLLPSRRHQPASSSSSLPGGTSASSFPRKVPRAARTLSMASSSSSSSSPPPLSPPNPYLPQWAANASTSRSTNINDPGNNGDVGDAINNGASGDAVNNGASGDAGNNGASGDAVASSSTSTEDNDQLPNKDDVDDMVEHNNFF